jgi:hypothetical protein
MQRCIEREREREIVLTFSADKRVAQCFVLRNYYRKDLCMQREAEPSSQYVEVMVYSYDST